VSYATLGALILRRAGNRIGWIMLGAGAAQAFLTLASIYAVIGVATFPGSLPAAKQVGTLAECSFPAVVFTVAFMFLLFPTATLPSRRWRPVAAAGLLLAALSTAGREFWTTQRAHTTPQIARQPGAPRAQEPRRDEWTICTPKSGRGPHGHPRRSRGCVNAGQRPLD
jgi:hypothetical protein